MQKFTWVKSMLDTQLWLWLSSAYKLTWSCQIVLHIVQIDHEPTFVPQKERQYNSSDSEKSADRIGQRTGSKVKRGGPELFRSVPPLEPIIEFPHDFQSSVLRGSAF